jgi:DNA-binding NarL/FixJ family response regulator
MAIRVLLADDQAMVRAGFAMILNAQSDIDVVGEAEDGESAIAEAARLAPDVIVMDIQMPKLDGVSATRAVLARGDGPTRVLVVTTFDIDEYVYEALRAGASGFLLKNAPPEELVHAVRVVAAGDSLLSPQVTTRLIEAFCKQPAIPSAPPPVLAELIAQGLFNSEIAERLVVSHGTVRTHVARILMKLDLRDRVQAVVLAYETGIVRRGHTDPTPLADGPSPNEKRAPTGLSSGASEAVPGPSRD